MAARHINRSITQFPWIAPSDLIGNRTGSLFAFPDRTISYWYSARTAIWQGIHRIGLKRGDRILAPVYACGAEIDVLLKAELILDYYRILPDLTPDLDHVNELCEMGAKAFMITHYFGFPQPMEQITAFAKARGLLLFENNAHGLYSADEDGTALGSFGDIAVLSFTKALAMPDGGALILKSSADRKPDERVARPPGRRAVAGRVKRLVERTFSHRYPTATHQIKTHLVDPFIGWVKSLGHGSPPQHANAMTQDREREIFELKLERASWGMSSCAEWLLHRSLPAEIVIARRRENFLAIQSHFAAGEHVAPLRGDLPLGCCPLSFPVLAQDGDGLRKFLVANSVEAHRFGFVYEAIPTDQFPLEQRLKRNVVFLPIHQGLHEADMRYIVGLLDRWNQEAGTIASA